MRLAFVAIAILVALVIGRLTVQEPPPRIQRVRDPVMIHVPAPTPPPAPRHRATLEDVRRDWHMEGRLSCSLVQR